mgnify:CR=1 FL=1
MAGTAPHTITQAYEACRKKITDSPVDVLAVVTSVIAQSDQQRSPSLRTCVAVQDESGAAQLLCFGAAKRDMIVSTLKLRPGGKHFSLCACPLE